MMRVIQLAMATVLTFAGSAVFAGSQNAAMLDRIFVDLRDAPDFTLRSVENGNNEIVGHIFLAIRQRTSGETRLPTQPFSK